MRVMPRKNRSTIKHHHRTQRSKLLRLSDGERIYRRLDQAGSVDRSLALAVLLGLLLAAVMTGTIVLAERADARAVRIEDPQTEMVKRNPVLYVEHVHRKWFYAELADGSAWMVTRCKTDEIPNRRTSCWWNAATMGNGEGRSFMAINGHKHQAVRGTVVR